MSMFEGISNRPRDLEDDVEYLTTTYDTSYTWNYAMLIAHGPSNEALIKSPIFRAMEGGTLARFEETRVPE